MKEFRWHRGEHEEFYKKINRFNAKIKRAKERGYEYDLPSQLSYKEELNKILKTKGYTREQFNKQIKYIDTFLSKDALDIKKGNRGAKIPVWEFKHIKNEVLPQINKTRMEQKKKLQQEEATDRGKKLGVKVQDMPDLATNRIREKKFNWKGMSTPDFEKFKESLGEYNRTLEQWDKQMQENYLKAIEHEMDSKDAETLLKIIKKLPQQEVIKNIYNDVNLGFTFVYSRADYDQRFNALHQAWKRISKEYNKRQEQKEK